MVYLKTSYQLNNCDHIELETWAMVYCKGNIIHQGYQSKFIWTMLGSALVLAKIFGWKEEEEKKEKFS